MTTINQFSRHQIDPADWSHVGIFYRGSDEDMMWAYREDERELEARIGNYLREAPEDFELGRYLDDDVRFHDNTGCTACGAHFLHGAVFLNSETAELIAVGHDCARKYYGVDSRDEILIRKARKMGEVRRKAEAGIAFAIDHDIVADLTTDHYIIEDIGRKLTRYGDLSDRQVELVKKIAREDREYEERKAEREASMADVPALIEGRRDMTGTIVSTKWQESVYGGALKMLVELDTRNRVWGTVPAAINVGPDPLEGARVTFTGTVERSTDDDHFGVFKRPTKAQIERTTS